MHGSRGFCPSPERQRRVFVSVADAPGSDERSLETIIVTPEGARPLRGLGVKRYHHPKAVIGGRPAGGFGDAAGSAALIADFDTRTAPHHVSAVPFLRTRRVLLGALAVGFLAVPVGTPFPDIP